MYTVVFNTRNSTKNKFQDAVLEYLRSLDRTIIKDSDLPEFENEVLHTINKIHSEKFARCNPLIISFWSMHNFAEEKEICKKKDRALSGIQFCSLDLYYAEKFYKGEK